MKQVYHANATTNVRLRTEINNSTSINYELSTLSSESFVKCIKIIAVSLVLQHQIFVL